MKYPEDYNKDLKTKNNDLTKELEELRGRFIYLLDCFKYN